MELFLDFFDMFSSRVSSAILTVEEFFDYLI